LSLFRQKANDWAGAREILDAVKAKNSKQPGLWATYGLAPVAGETLTEHGSNEINNSLWEIKAPDLDDPTYRIVPRGSGWRLPCVIF